MRNNKFFRFAILGVASTFILGQALLPVNNLSSVVNAEDTVDKGPERDVEADREAITGPGSEGEEFGTPGDDGVSGPAENMDISTLDEPENLLPNNGTEGEGDKADGEIVESTVSAPISENVEETSDDKVTDNKDKESGDTVALPENTEKTEDKVIASENTASKPDRESVNDTERSTDKSVTEGEPIENKVDTTETDENKNILSYLDKDFFDHTMNPYMEDIINGNEVKIEGAENLPPIESLPGLSTDEGEGILSASEEEKPSDMNIENSENNSIKSEADSSEAKESEVRNSEDTSNENKEEVNTENQVKALPKTAVAGIGSLFGMVSVAVSGIFVGIRKRK